MPRIQPSPEAMKAKTTCQRQWPAKNQVKCREYIRYYRKRRGADLHTAGNVTDSDKYKILARTCLECNERLTQKRGDAKNYNEICEVRYNRNQRIRK